MALAVIIKGKKKEETIHEFIDLGRGVSVIEWLLYTPLHETAQRFMTNKTTVIELCNYGVTSAN